MDVSSIGIRVLQLQLATGLGFRNQDKCEGINAQTESFMHGSLYRKGFATVTMALSHCQDHFVTWPNLPQMGHSAPPCYSLIWTWFVIMPLWTLPLPPLPLRCTLCRGLGLYS